MIKIAFTGSHSTGKTTLLKKYIESCNLKVGSITEVARTIISRGFPLGKDATVDSYINYVNEQLKAEAKVLEKDYDVIISDRTILDTVGYSLVNKRIPRPFIPDYLIEMLTNVWLLEKDFYDLYLYFPIEFPMDHDGVRPEDDKYRDEVGDELLKVLKTHNINFKTITGSVNERVLQLSEILKELI